MCGFNGIAYLKIMVPEFLISKECIVGKPRLIGKSHPLPDVAEGLSCAYALFNS
jgi:hypothetical protein